MVTEAELRDRVVTRLRSQIGYTSGDYERSIFGLAATWRSPWLNGATAWQGMYCDRYSGWGIDWELGARAAIAAHGRQPWTNLPSGWAATWLHLEEHERQGRVVPFKDAQLGDQFLFSLPGRKGNRTNHIGTFVRWYIRGVVAVVVEGNLARPGHGLHTIGVWEHYRDDTYVVAVCRPDWDAAAVIYNVEHGIDDLTKVSTMLLALGYPADVAGLRAYQKDRGLVVDGIPGDKTTTALEVDMTTIKDVLNLLKDSAESQDEKLDRAINAALWGGPERTVGNATPIINAVPDNTVRKLLEHQPDGAKGGRHHRFRYHDLESLLLYAADGGLALGAQVAALTALVKELATNRGVDGDALVAAATASADRAASDQAAMDVAVDVDQED